MKYTLRIPDYIFEGCQGLAKKHDVKLATIFNSLIRRGLIAGLVVPFNPLPSHQDDLEFKRRLEAEAKELEGAFCEYFGVDLSKLSYEELLELADGKATARAVISKHFPDYPYHDNWDSLVELYRDVAAWEADQKALDKELAAMGDDDALGD